MKLVREHIESLRGSAFAALDIDEPRFDGHYHHHPEIEIAFIEQSQGQFLIGDVGGAFGPGDLFLLGSDLPHQFRNWEAGRARAKVLQFRYELLEAPLSFLAEFHAIKRLLLQAQRGLRFSESTRAAACKAVAHAFRAPEGPLRFARLIEILHLLAQDAWPSPIASVTYAQPAQPKKVARLERVLNYIEANWQDDIRLPAAAKVAAMHPRSLSRFFRQRLGLTFQDYVTQLRLNRAARLLLETDRPVADIAFDCGFRSLANFNRHFRARHQLPPTAYRKRQNP